MRARVSTSRSRSSSLPSACAQGGMHDDRLFCPAVYGYWSAGTSCPAARAESIIATTSAAFGQLRTPAALRW